MKTFRDPCAFGSSQISLTLLQTSHYLTVYSHLYCYGDIVVHMKGVVQSIDSHSVGSGQVFSNQARNFVSISFSTAGRVVKMSSLSAMKDGG